MKNNIFDDEQLNLLLFEDLLPPSSKEELEELEDHCFSTLHATKMEGLFSSLESEEKKEVPLPLVAMLKNALVILLCLTILAFPSLSSLAEEATSIELKTIHGRNSIELQFSIQGESLPPPILKIHSLPEGCRLNKEEVTSSSHMRDYIHPMGYLLQIEKMKPPERLLIEGEEVWDKKVKGHYVVYQKHHSFRTVYLFKNNWLYRVTTSKSLLFSQEILENID